VVEYVELVSGMAHAVTVTEFFANQN
jgi:hypothetical protein